MSDFEALDKLVEECPYETKLAVTAWVFRNIVDHAKEGGSYRYLIYDRLGFGTDAYVPLYEAGGMEISNEFDMSLKPDILEIVQENKFEPLKNLLRLCDEPGCFREVSSGFPTDNGYRWTCHEHSKFAKDKNGT